MRMRLTSIREVISFVKTPQLTITVHVWHVFSSSVTWANCQYALRLATSWIREDDDALRELKEQAKSSVVSVKQYVALLSACLCSLLSTAEVGEGGCIWTLD